MRNFAEIYGIETLVIILLAMAGLSICILWGSASVLLVGKRMLQNSAGRNRTSFSAVRSKSSKYISNLLLTGILRDCFTVLWSILLIIPGIIYSIRTTFYHVAIVCDGKEYRGALTKSKELVQGHTWYVLWYLIATVCVLFIPVTIVANIAEAIIKNIDGRFIFLADIISAALHGLATCIFLLTNIGMYASLKEQNS